MKCLFRLIMVLVIIICALGVVVFYLGNQSPQQVITITTPVVTATPHNIERIELVEPLPGFEPRDEYVTPPGTEIEGVGVIDNGFALRGIDKVEFVTGYTVVLPENFDVAGYNLLENSDKLLGLVILGLNAVGMNDEDELPGIDKIGNEAIGKTVTTDWQGSKLKIDAIIFRRLRTGALVAVIYREGRTPSVSVIDIAIEMDSRIQQEN
jgi:hypothetical protein